MTGAAPSLAVEVYKRSESSGLTANNSHHERKSKYACTNKRFGRAADADPYRQRILQWARVDCLTGKRGAVFAGPVHFGAFPDFQEKLEFFSEERVVIFKTQAEKRVGLDK